MFKITCALALLTLSLAACSQTAPIVKTQFVDRDVPVQATLDPRLTAKTDLPMSPAFACRDDKGQPTICHDALFDYIDALREVARHALGQVDAIRELQPKP